MWRGECGPPAGPPITVESIRWTSSGYEVSEKTRTCFHSLPGRATRKTSCCGSLVKTRCRSAPLQRRRKNVYVLCLISNGTTKVRLKDLTVGERVIAPQHLSRLIQCTLAGMKLSRDAVRRYYIQRRSGLRNRAVSHGIITP